jgi:hypothetical protein
MKDVAELKKELKKELLALKRDLKKVMKLKDKIAAMLESKVTK